MAQRLPTLFALSAFSLLDRAERPERPSFVAVFLWVMGMVIIVMSIYVALTWQGSVTVRDLLVMLLSFSSGVTQIAVGALIDMHTTRYKTRKRELCNFKIGSGLVLLQRFRQN